MQVNPDDYKDFEKMMFMLSDVFVDAIEKQIEANEHPGNERILCARCGGEFAVKETTRIIRHNRFYNVCAPCDDIMFEEFENRNGIQIDKLIWTKKGTIILEKYDE